MDNVSLESPLVTPEEYEQAKPLKSWGLLGSINLYGCNQAKINDAEIIKNFVSALCQAIGMKAHGPTYVEKFAEGDLEGYSMMQFIETSTITAHFDDKMGDCRAFIDIFSCKYFDVKTAASFCGDYFNAKEAKVWSLIRN